MLRKAPSILCIVSALTGCQKAFSTATHSARTTHYQVLGVHAAASADQIKAAFRQKAKELHPDLNAQWSASDGEAFLRLVTAYEVLSDPQQRRMYDVSNDSGLPPILRRAAASAEQHTADHHDGHRTDVFSWRYGLAKWASQGPSSTDIRAPDADLRWSVMAAVSRHRGDLEQDRHTALVKAFLGPQLEVLPGQLPAAFEADERADQFLTTDLLHLVHGRALIGVVRLKRHLALEGTATVAAALPDVPHSVTPALLPLTAALPQHNHTALLSPDSSQATADAPTQQDQVADSARRLHPYAWQPQEDNSAQRPTADVARAEAAGSDDEISKAEWQQLLQQQHPLHGHYDWAAESAEAAYGSAAGQQDTATQLLEQLADTCCDSTGCPATVAAGGNSRAELGVTKEDAGKGQLQCGTAAVNEWDCLGGAAARAAWEESQAAQYCCQNEVAVDCSYASGQLSGSQGVGCCSRPYEEGTQHPSYACSKQQTKEEKHQQHVQELHSPRKQQQQRQTHDHQQQRRHFQQQQAKQLKNQGRLWRWLRTPSADWAAADWSFNDSSEGVLVLEMTGDARQLVTLAVRDDTQHNKPCKIYVNGAFVAAVLGDIVMEPLTGRLKSVLYRFSTPGVQHLYFYLPSKGASRVLARLQRRWMPPSATWLFPPRSDLHDVGGWSIEWEGHESADKPGWMHPAVYVLTAACYSRDMEQRKVRQGPSAVQLLWQRAADPGSALGRALQWLQGAWSRRTKGASTTAQ